MPAKIPTARAASLLVGTGIFLSRIAGLVRDRVFAHYLGNSEAAGAFKAALRIPNFLQNLFGEGVLSASFIPVYARLQAQGAQEDARRLAGFIGAVLMLAMALLVLLGVVFTPVFVDILAPGFSGDTRLLMVSLVRILFPGVGLLVLSAWCLGILNSHGHFFLSYVAPVFWNLAMIVALVVYGRSSSQEELALTLAWASVVGSVLQVMVQLPYVFRYRPQVRLFLKTRLEAAHTIFRNFTPVLVGRGVVQVSAYVDGVIASFLGASAVASLAYAQTLYLLPISLFGMAVAAAELPGMSASAGLGDPEKLRERLRAGRRQISFFVVPSLIAFIVLGRYVVSALYQTGAFGPEDTLYVWYVLIGAAIGLQAATWGRLYSSAFYALHDVRRPLYFALVRLLLALGLSLLLAFPLRPLLIDFLLFVGLPLPNLPGIELALGVVGLTAGSGMSGWVETFLLKRALTKRIGSIEIPVSFLVKVWGAALMAAGLALVARKVFPEAIVFFRYDLLPLFVLAVFGFCYLAFVSALQVEEGHRLWRKRK